MDFLSIANSPALWIIAAICVGTVIAQGALYVRMALKNAKPLGISKKECFSAVRSGAIAAIGPSIANALSTISLVAIVGAPIAWIRLSMIGNAATESGAASIGAMAAGTSLGSSDFGIQAMSVVWFTMAINGCGWLIMTLLFNHRMGQVRDKISGGDKLWLAIFPGDLYDRHHKLLADIVHREAGCVSYSRNSGLHNRCWGTDTE